MLKASLAERLGHLSAADADRAERDDFWGIERPLRQAHVAISETEIERAFRRAGARPCHALRRFMPDPGSAECSWMMSSMRLRLCRERGNEARSAYHARAMARQVQAYSAGVERCR